jgi:glutaredoxin 3
MSPVRDAASLIWPGGLRRPMYSMPQDAIAGKGRRSKDQLEATVYARTRCLRSWRVKRLLKRQGYAFKVVDVTGKTWPASYLPGTEGSNTVPQLFVAGRLVGGLREISALQRSGDLDRLLHGEI